MHERSLLKLLAKSLLMVLGAGVLVMLLWTGVGWVWQGRVAFGWLASLAPAAACPNPAVPCSKAEALDKLLGVPK